MLMKYRAVFAGIVAAVTATGTHAQQARDYITIVGSSTVYPFATVVAEQFGRTTQFKTPKIESTGSGGGLKLFCAGVGVEHPDITNASRRIKASEQKRCKENGVADVIEVKVGYDGIAFANSRSSEMLDLTRRDIFLALAKDIPDPAGGEGLVPNPYRSWNEVNPSLPNRAIEVLGPPPTSGTRDAFLELVMEGGCKSYPHLKAMKKSDKSRYKAICHAIREDGVYIEAGENDNLIVQKLEANPEAFGIFGFSFLEQNADKVQGAKIDGVTPEFETISDGSYPVSRPLYFYVKKAHVGVIPGIAEYLGEFTADRTWGEEGYLTDKGLIPMPDDERKSFADAAGNLTPMSPL
jgi:phosphate transport system substrate-binding protein